MNLEPSGPVVSRPAPSRPVAAVGATVRKPWLGYNHSISVPGAADDCLCSQQQQQMQQQQHPYPAMTDYELHNPNGYNMQELDPVMAGFAGIHPMFTMQDTTGKS